MRDNSDDNERPGDWIIFVEFFFFFPSVWIILRKAVVYFVLFYFYSVRSSVHHRRSVCVCVCSGFTFTLTLRYVREICIFFSSSHVFFFSGLGEGHSCGNVLVIQFSILVAMCRHHHQLGLLGVKVKSVPSLLFFFLETKNTQQIQTRERDKKVRERKKMNRQWQRPR